MVKLAIYIFTIITFISCSLSQKIKDGDTAYERKQYAVAKEMLEDEYDESSNDKVKARKAYLLGRTYFYLKNDKFSVEWLEKAVVRNHGNDAIRDLAYGYKSLGQYTKAIQTFELLIQNVGSRAEISREIAICKEAINWSKKQSEEYTVQKSYVNSVQAEYAPVMYEGDYVVFTSDRGISSGSERYNWTGNKFSDLYIMTRDGGQVQKFDGEINTENNDGTASFSSDFMEMFFTRCYDEERKDAYCKLMYSERYDGVWSIPTLLPFIKEGMNYGQPTLVENDSVLIFTSKIDNTVSDYDLFYSVKDENGTWSEGIRMPDVINTSGNEMFPVGDKDTLYFSSDFHPGLGGLDIFRTYLDENGKWQKPERMPVPINSSHDDFSFIIDYGDNLKRNVLQTGFFSSTRQGIGDDDIYRFQKKKIEIEEEVEEVPVEEDKPERIISYYLAGKVVEPNYAEDNNPNTPIVSYKPVGLAAVNIEQDSLMISAIRTDRKGFFLEQLEGEKLYQIIAGKNRYLSNSIEISTKNIEVDESQELVTINVEIVLNKLYKGREINLPNIFYEFNEAFITDEAKPTLDNLTKMLKDNPDIRIQLSAHTDCRGEVDFNQDLSQRRALSAVLYLIEKGIDKERLVPKGFGESQLEISCECEECTEEEHQINRRTTFTIIS